MSIELIETLFLSEKREKMLLLLIDGPADIKKINSTLEVTSSSILPQIKKLREAGLVHKDDNGTYELTTIGKLIVENMKPLSCMLKVFDKSDTYWDERELNTIPEKLRNKIGDLGDIEFIVPDLDHMYDLPEQMVHNIISSHKISSLQSFFHPDYPGLYKDLASKEVLMDLIVTESVFERLENEYEEEMRSILEAENTTFLVCNDDLKPPTFNFTENFAYISFFNFQGRYDHKDIITHDPGAIEWCKELFTYYSRTSEPINK